MVDAIFGDDSNPGGPGGWQEKAKSECAKLPSEGRWPPGQQGEVIGVRFAQGSKSGTTNYEVVYDDGSVCHIIIRDDDGTVVHGPHYHPYTKLDDET